MKFSRKNKSKKNKIKKQVGGLGSDDDEIEKIINSELKKSKEREKERKLAESAARAIQRSIKSKKAREVAREAEEEKYSFFPKSRLDSIRNERRLSSLKRETERLGNHVPLAHDEPLPHVEPSRRRVTISVGGWNSFVKVAHPTVHDRVDPTLPVVWFFPRDFPSGIGVGSRVLESKRPDVGPQAGAVVEAIESKYWNNKPLTYVAVTFSGPFKQGVLHHNPNEYIPVIFETEINT